ALGAAAGSQNDGLGTSFSGSSSLENQYYVDGVNTTGLTLGTVGSPVINDFIKEIEVITGGYNAEYGRATGGVVHVVTKSGSTDGHPDVDPKTGFFITDPIDTEVRTATSVAYNILGKINYAATPENQGQLTIQALPGSSSAPNLFGPADQGGATDGNQLTT